MPQRPLALTPTAGGAGRRAGAAELAADALAELVRAYRLAGRPLWRRGLLRGVAAAIEHQPIARLAVPDTVVDLAAGDGRFALFALEAWPGCRVVALEPLPGPAARFREVLGDHPRVTLVEAAPAGPPARAAAALRHHVGVDDLRGRVLLKLDAPGLELETLRASERHLDLFAYVYVGCSYARPRQGQPLASDVMAFLNRRGFTLVAEVNPVSEPPIGTIRSDCLFERLD